MESKKLELIKPVKQALGIQEVKIGSKLNIIGGDLGPSHLVQVDRKTATHEISVDGVSQKISVTDCFCKVYHNGDPNDLRELEITFPKCVAPFGVKLFGEESKGTPNPNPQADLKKRNVKYSMGISLEKTSEEGTSMIEWLESLDLIMADYIFDNRRDQLFLAKSHDASEVHRSFTAPLVREKQGYFTLYIDYYPGTSRFMLADNVTAVPLSNLEDVRLTLIPTVKFRSFRFGKKIGWCAYCTCAIVLDITEKDTSLVQGSVAEKVRKEDPNAVDRVKRQISLFKKKTEQVKEVKADLQEKREDEEAPPTPNISNLVKTVPEVNLDKDNVSSSVPSRSVVDQDDTPEEYN
jgi:hypothetical protein